MIDNLDGDKGLFQVSPDKSVDFRCTIAPFTVEGRGISYN
ncbi:hypothetical protein BMS3Bbin14_00748 [bacterium BMS3Bbin14]|nr:hypothetical protein BMS3Bbin14_00748 [bacterium BMS3Bbin14]